MTTIRAYGPRDEPGLVAVWNAAMWADPIDALAWRTRYLLDQAFTPGLCLVAELDGVVVGFVLGMPPQPEGSDAWVVAFGVLPDVRRQGVGRALFEHLHRALAPTGATRVLIGPWVPGYVAPGVDEAAYPEAIAFLQAIGGSVASRPLSMKASLTGYRPAEGLAARAGRVAGGGISVRPATVADVLPLLAFLKREFPHWEGDARGVMAELFGGSPGNVTLHVAERADGIVGYAQSRAERFGPFGVSESLRGQGVGAVLLNATLLAMRARGFHCAWFLWTSDRAAALYQRHGFEEVRRFALMTVPIDKG